MGGYGPFTYLVRIEVLGPRNFYVLKKMLVSLGRDGRTVEEDWIWI
jgi:hypothetical protein